MDQLSMAQTGEARKATVRSFVSEGDENKVRGKGERFTSFIQETTSASERPGPPSGLHAWRQDGGDQEGRLPRVTRITLSIKYFVGMITLLSKHWVTLVNKHSVMSCLFFSPSRVTVKRCTGREVTLVNKQ